MGFIDEVKATIKKQARAATSVPDLRADYAFKLSPAGDLLAKDLQAKVVDKYVQLQDGKITPAAFDEFVGGARSVLAQVAKPDKSFGDHLKLAGGVVGSAVVGLVTAGPVGAASGFLAGAAAAKTPSGIAPTSAISVGTPPIVPPDQQHTQTASLSDGGPHPALILSGWLVMLWIVWKAIRKKIRQ